MEMAILVAPREVAAMLPIPICSRCEQRLREASIAMLRHGADMQTAIDVRRRAKPSKEQRQEFVARLVASFNAAQSAWDAYHKHLTKHGLLKP
jgi:hypothetical protein